MGIQNPTPENSWYFNGGRPREQEGLYDLLVRRKGMPTEQVEGLITAFYEMHTDKQRKFFRRYALDIVSSRFEEFINYVAQRTGIEFLKRPEGERRCKLDTDNSYWDNY